MAGTPTPKSYEQILGRMLQTYMGKRAINDLEVGSTVSSFFEAFAQAIYRASGDVFAILRDKSVDRARGEALKRLEREEGLIPIEAKVATGRVTIIDTSFVKQATKVYAGSPPPNIGSTVIRVSDASQFTPTGAIYIGRGTPNVEGPISYSSITNVGSFYEINLVTPTTKYHNVSEVVILSQGGLRNIDAGEVVRTVASGSSKQIAFTTTKPVIILDGETTITDVPVAAQEPGTDGNVPRNAIREFATPPFSGATVTNPSPFTTGRNAQTDDEIKDRIKRARASKGLGTALAIKNATINAQAPDENATVVSNEIFSDGTNTTLYIDNGEGYEPKTQGVGLEYIVDSALGGEDRFQLALGGSQTSVAKAFLESQNLGPFAIAANDRLAVLVGGVLSEHVFLEGDFRSNGAANAFEVVASINGNADLAFIARTSNDGTKVVIQAKEEVDEFIEITEPTTGNDASLALQFPAIEAQTLRLYKNNKPLSRNGRRAVLETNNQSDWTNSIADGNTLIIKVDNTSFITYTITNNDFLNEGTHATVSKDNTIQSWINVFNNKIIGVTASQNGNRIVLTSNLGTNSRAALEIDPTSTLVVNGMFNASGVLTATGQEPGFILSRNTGQFRVIPPLSEGDSLTAGSDFTEGSIESDLIAGGTVTLTDDAEQWYVIDNSSAEIIPNGVLANSEIYISKQGSNILRFRSVLDNAFGLVQPGDYFVLWSEDVDVNNRLEGRVYAVGTDTLTNDYFEVRLTAAEYAAAVVEGPITFTEGLAFLRSETPPQKIKIATGVYNINTLAGEIQSQLEGSSVFVDNDEILIVASKTKSSLGSILLFTQNESAKNFSMTEGSFGSTTFTHFAYNTSSLDQTTSFPAFIHAAMAQDENADTPDSFISSFESALDLAALDVEPNLLVYMQNPYLHSGNFVEDAQAYDEGTQINDIIGGTTVNIAPKNTIRRIRTDDRYYLLNTLNFNFNDSVVFVLDNNATEKTFPINLYRRAITNTTQPINSDEFRAYDVDAGPTTEFAQFFGDDYAFDNHKALMRAKNVIDPNSATDEDAVLFRSALWGKEGEKVRVGYIYPGAPDQEIGHSIEVDDETTISISLKSGAAVPNNIDGTTEWNVTVTPNTPVAGVDEVTYTWNTVGTDPSMTTLAPGDYVSINNNGEFALENTGTFRISSATSTSFTVRRPNGVAVIESNVATLTVGTISLYEDNNTTAAEIVQYVTDEVSDWLIAELIDDNGISGAGVINLSTDEDNDFSLEFISLVDGINWIATSTLDALAPNAQFELKRTLQLPSYSTNTANAYAFNDGEELRIIPTTIKQVADFINVLAVSGISTLGQVDTALRQQLLQVSSNILGSNGAVKVSGGTANSSEALLLGSATLLVDGVKVNILKASSNGFAGGAWVKLAADNVQRKNTGISTTTQVTITPNQPNASESIIELDNLELTDRYFGESRNSIRTEGRAFHVEKHGSLVNISWDGLTGLDPLFEKTVDFNDVSGNMSVAYNVLTGYTEYTITTGDRNFVEVSIGDTVEITNFADPENNGIFEVVGVSEDGLTVAVDNPNGVDAVSAAVAPGDIEFTTTIREGDTVFIDAPFNPLNRGQYRLIRKFENSFYIDNPNAIEERVVVTTNPRDLGFDGTTEFDVTVSGNMTITWTTVGTAPTLENARMGDEVTLGTDFDVANQGTFMCVDSGDNYIVLNNASAVAESGVTISDVFVAHAPALRFSPYENAVEGDRFVISGDVLGENNQGSFDIVRVISKKKVAVSSIMETQTAVQLNELFVQVYLEEGIAYTGYKQIINKAVDPANPTRTSLVFDSSEQWEKIVEEASIVISAQSKLGYSSDLITGIDSYKYNTGLIREVNKIVYGDPRDNTTYPGVAAAGAEIFNEAAFIRRLQLAINVRLNTGVPFVRLAEQVRNNVAALINSTPIGQSIAISDIVSTVNSIPGVRAVSISSPAYDAQNDVIVVNSYEKPFIQDVLNDIVVSKVGS